MTSPNSLTVEQYIDQKVLPKYQPLVVAFRQLITNNFPELTEDMRGGTEAYPGVPIYRLNRIVITISPTKQGITFAFSKGAQFEDKYNLLEGLGNTAKNIRLSSLNDFDPDIMSYYIKQAIDWDRG